MDHLSPKPVSASAVDNHVYKAFPNDLNAHHNVFGGLVMSICGVVPDVIAASVAEKRRYEQAEIRRNARLRTRKELKSSHR